VADNPFRALPSVDRVLGHDLVRDLHEQSGELAVDLVRRVLQQARETIQEGNPPPTEDDIAAEVAALTERMLSPPMKRIINATGVILQTNLGRAPLSPSAIAAVSAVSSGYSNLEFDLEKGERGSRNSHLSKLLQQVTGAERALVVNNNASALLLVLSALAGGREVIISRGQAVEIGGGFRIPDVMHQSGAALVEVGTTNRTYGRDYEAAIGNQTAAIMRVHASNYRVLGFTAQPPLKDLARIAHERDVLLLDDLGSGCLLETETFGLAHEPTVGESMRDGADLCLFSGDKLLGGPQAGIIVGSKRMIDDLCRHPLTRALRPDKGTIAALHATLIHYARGEALGAIPVWQMISMGLDAISRRAETWAAALGPPAFAADSESMIGGGSLPGESLPTRVLAIPGEGAWLTRLARDLRLADPPVVARIDGGRLLFDPRTVAPEDEGVLCQAVRAAMAASPV
jgi:L-seryl-tRNA(Ser) seleniumtransferase